MQDSSDEDLAGKLQLWPQAIEQAKQVVQQHHRRRTGKVNHYAQADVKARTAGLASKCWPIWGEIAPRVRSFAATNCDTKKMANVETLTTSRRLKMAFLHDCGVFITAPAQFCHGVFSSPRLGMAKLQVFRKPFGSS